MPIEHHVFHVDCKGRGFDLKEVLEKSINVEVSVRRNENGKSISMSVKCPHNTGGHGQRCKASHPEVDKVGKGVLCAFAVDLPHASDMYSRVLHTMEAFPRILDALGFG
jgi:hypothetical protein